MGGRARDTFQNMEKGCVKKEDDTFIYGENVKCSSVAKGRAATIFVGNRLKVWV